MTILPKAIYRFNAIPINGMLHRIRTKNFTIHMETQKTPKSQSNLEKEKWSWRSQALWLQTILQSYSNQDSTELAPKQKYRSMVQDRKPRDKPTHIWSPNLRQSLTFFFFLNDLSLFLPKSYHFSFFLINSYFIYLFILAVVGLCFVRGLSLVAASGGHSSSWCGDHSSSRCAGLSISRPLPLRGTGSRHAGSAVVAHGPSCSVACGIFPDQGSNPCPLH